MFDNENGIDCGVVANGRYIVEYGQYVGTTYDERGNPVSTLHATIPCPENEPEIRIVVKVPAINAAVNAVLYVDGELCSSKCRSAEGPAKIVISSVRVSANEARSLKLKKLHYDPQSQHAVDGRTGTLQVDVWTGWKGAHSYEPILRYGEHVSHAADADMHKNAVNIADDKGASELTHKIDYGPVYIKPDRRRYFEKENLIARFIFFYRDKSYISLNGLMSTTKTLMAKRRREILQELAQNGPIELSD